MAEDVTGADTILDDNILEIDESDKRGRGV